MTPLFLRSIDMCHHTFKTGLDCHFASETLNPTCWRTASSYAIFFLVFVETFPMAMLDSKLRNPESVVFCLCWLKQLITRSCCNCGNSKGTLCRSYLFAIFFNFFHKHCLWLFLIVSSSLHTSGWCSICRLWIKLLVNLDIMLSLSTPVFSNCFVISTQRQGFAYRTLSQVVWHNDLFCMLPYCVLPPSPPRSCVLWANLNVS